MAISITDRAQVHQLGTFQSVETLTESTSTAIQTLDPHVVVHHLGVGTATGATVNRYLLGTASAAEGMDAVCLTTATGEADLVMTGTATGFLRFQADGDIVWLKLLNGTWRIIYNLGATFATATGTA